METRVAQLFTLRDGKVLTSHDYFDHAEAAREAGLPE
jgi:ketosteroid isomerase-like protein